MVPVSVLMPAPVLFSYATLFPLILILRKRMAGQPVNCMHNAALTQFKIIN